jgi:hypothetical protein
MGYPDRFSPGEKANDGKELKTPMSGARRDQLAAAAIWRIPPASRLEGGETEKRKRATAGVARPFWVLNLVEPIGIEPTTS